MFKTILAFIKAHTIATAVTTTVVVSTVVATPIVINQVQKPEQEVTQVQENVVDNTITDNTIEENTETSEENITEENTTVPEEEQKVETSKEENKQEQSQNQETTKPTTTTSNNSKTDTPTTQEANGNWVRYNFDDFSYILVNKTTQRVKPYHCWGETVSGQEYSYSELKSIIIPAMRNQYQEWLERNIAIDNQDWQEFGVPKENKINGYKKELEKLDRFKNYVINSGEEYSMSKVVSFEGSGSYVFHPDWIDTYKEQVKGFIETEQEELAPYIENRHAEENYIRDLMVTFEANVNTILSNL